MHGVLARMHTCVCAMHRVLATVHTCVCAMSGILYISILYKLIGLHGALCDVHASFI